VNRVLCLLSILIAVAVLGDLTAPYRDPIFRVDVVEEHGAALPASISAAAPLRLDAGSGRRLRIAISAGGNTVGGHVEVAAAGGNLFARMDGRDTAIPLGPGYQRCTAADAQGIWRCRIAFAFQGTRSMEFAAVAAPAEVRAANVVIVKNSGGAAVGIETLFVFFGVLGLIGGVFLFVPLTAAIRTGLLTAAGAAWLMISGGPGGIALLAIVAGIYLLLRLQLAGPASSWRFAAVVGVVALILVAVKVYGLQWLGAFANPGSLAIGVPLGFAFFVIRALDLSFRVATREVEATSAREYFAYMLFPATLAAGPIFTLTQFRRAAIERATIVDWTAGLARIGIGLTKKVVADLLLARIVGPKLTMLYADPLALPASDLWVLLFANACYVYLDFSGYSDIAIGVGRQLGWRVPENFDFPLFRSSMRAFWQRWHMTLSAWVARWVHFFTAFVLRRSHPVTRAALPVTVCLLFIGLWHEVQLSYVLWGLHHSIGILLGDLAGMAVVVSGWSVLRRVGGLVFVWAWVALSHCFTLISDPLLALEVYWRALSFGW
jgi:alginate O-acetyltransferase complex protein AlgI